MQSYYDHRNKKYSKNTKVAFLTFRIKRVECVHQTLHLKLRDLCERGRNQKHCKSQTEVVDGSKKTDTTELMHI